MSLKKKLAMAVVTTTAGAAIMAAGSFAYFNATTVNQNNVFTSGKIQLGQTVTLGTHDNIKPGDTGASSIILSNLDSTLDSNLKAQFGAVAGDAALAKALAVTMSVGSTSVPLNDSDADGVITYYDLVNQTTAHTVDLGAFASTSADKTVSIDWTFTETNSDQNSLQGLSFTVPVSFEAKQ